MNILRKLFTSYNDRQVSKYYKTLENINEHYNNLIKKNESEKIIPADLTEDFRQRINNGETLDEILPEAYALVKFVMKKFYDEKHSYSDGGMHFTWDMVPYDVQIIGSIAMHEGKIVEMATGEGKTLVAVMPLYINAIAGKGTYLITVNDYLARRDRTWMYPIYRELGVSVGLIQMGMKPAERREQYECDIVYVTNNEFGFDYLRDNLTYHKREKVHRDDFNFAIIDEVDSVLIDEARTPLIISGLPMDGTDQKKTYKIYSELNSSVNEMVRKQKRIVENIMKDAVKSVNDGNEEGIFGLLKVKKGFPKMPELIKLMQDADINRKMENLENALMRDKETHKLDEGLLFSMEERAHSVHITDQGEREFSKIKNDSDFFVLPQLATELLKIDNDDSLSDGDKLKKKDELNDIYAAKSERIHSVQQLLRAYTMFVKDVDYIVQEGKVIIVDEHTGRLMPGRRFSEGMHSAIEAKESVDIEEETKTLATITLQNLFRMYDKLSGMTGTAETEAKEFMHIYKMPVVVIPTNKPIIRDDREDIMFVRKDEKINYIDNRIMKVHNAGIPLLVGTASVASSEQLDAKLKNRNDDAGKKINYSILNAKNHENEANIVAEAGEQGSVTIATNMAGRGTDIKLGKTIKMLSERSALIQALKMKKADRTPRIVCESETSKSYIEYLLENDNYLSDKKMYFREDGIEILTGDVNDENDIYIADPENKDERFVCISHDDKGDCTEYVSPGLYVLGTEKHDSRRIDRQLRGRSGRQGDAGVSQFTVSLEDDLMRIFGSDRMSSLIGRLETMSTEGAVSHRMRTSSIETAQKKIENINFERRKFLLEYDDVINKQREVVYELRDFFLYKAPPIEFVNSSLFKELTDKIAQAVKNDINTNNNIQLTKHQKYINGIYKINISVDEMKQAVNSNTLPHLIAEQIMPDIIQNIESIMDYIMENIPQTADEKLREFIMSGSYMEEWNYDGINDYLMNYYHMTVEQPKEDMNADEFTAHIVENIENKIRERCNVPDEYKDKLLYVLTFSFLRAIDAQWVEQLYELEAIREGITLRGYAQKDPLVEFKREAYSLFSVLIDNIYEDFTKKFFDSKLLSDIEEIKSSKIEAFKPQLFANASESKKIKQKPIERNEKKIGRNDPCWCGSGKKYKHCHGKNE